MKWRRINNVLHRDLGYLCFGLTVIYALSGIAVNHIGDWNPNYRIERRVSHLDVAVFSRLSSQEIEPTVLKAIQERRPVKNSLQTDPETLKIFVEGNTVTVNLKNGVIREERVAKRSGLFQINFLHLNHPKRLWTWFADLYAIALLFLACTGLFVLRGKNGITGRGAWLAFAGFLLPLFFLWLYS